MNRRKIIGVDVDLTLVDTGKLWLNWLIASNGGKSQEYKDYLLSDTTPSTLLPYNLSTLFPDVEDPFSFWRNLDYKMLEAKWDVVETLRELSEDFDIVFISRIKGNHSKSKYYWLKANFPFIREYVAVHDKSVMNGSVVAMIDDRKDVLQGFDEHKRILFKTDYEQSVDCKVGHVMKDWSVDSSFELEKYLRSIC